MKIQEFQEKLNKITPDKELNNEEMMFLGQLMLNTSKDIQKNINSVSKDSDIYEPLQNLLNELIPQIFKQRIEKLTTLTIATNAFWSLCGFMNTPGHAVIYAYYLKHKLPKNTFINMDVLYQQIFPLGLFSDEQLNEIWDAQKVNEDTNEFTCIGAPDNMLDYLEFWK